jgi:peptidoglycan/xylan/chitin deacetylase (PgdA/CDA1 family)
LKIITIFFDLEAPFLWKNAPIFDLENAVHDICAVLDKHKVKATFNTLGVLAEKFPQVVSKLHNDGHEIASHGYAHENFAKITYAKLDAILKKTEIILQQVTGEKPIGIRSPWLIRNKQIYNVLKNRNYKWASNWHVPFWITKSQAQLRAISYLKYVTGKAIYNVKWIFRKKKPLLMDLMEIPLLSPLDIYCIYPFPEPLENSPEFSLKEAYDILVKHYKSSDVYFNLNFHEHVVGTCNRVCLLDRILGYLSRQSNIHFLTARQLLESLNKKD